MSNSTSTDILTHIKAEIKEAEADLQKAKETLHCFTDESLVAEGLLKPEARIAGLCKDYLYFYSRVKQLKDELHEFQWFCQEQ